MTQTDPLEKITKRTQRYWYEDGIWEIGFGIVCAMLGGFYLLSAGLQRGTPTSMILMLAQMAVIFFAYYITSKVTAFLKERITYPRTGYVAYRKPSPKTRVKRAVQAGLIAAGVAVLVAAVAAIQLSPNRMPLIIAVVMAGMLVFVGHRYELARMYGLAVLTLLLAYGITFFPLNEEASVGAFFAGFSLLLILSGVITLLIYIGRTRPAGEADDYQPPVDGSNV